MRKTHFAISELLEMGLEILPNTVQGLYYKAKKENWLFRETPCQGGKGGVKREYALPPAVLDAIWQRRAAAAVAEGAYGQPEPCVAGAAYQGEVLDAGRLNGSTAAQRGREGARIGVLRLVERIMAESGCGKEAAELGYSGTTLSLIVHGKYAGKTDRVAAAVAARYETVACPYQGKTIPLHECRSTAKHPRTIR